MVMRMNGRMVADAKGATLRFTWAKAKALVERANRAGRGLFKFRVIDHPEGLTGLSNAAADYAIERIR